MLIVKADDIEIRFPASWEQVTLAQFTRLMDAGSRPRDILLAICDKPELLRALPDATADYQIYNCEALSYLRGELPDLFTPKHIKTVTLNGKSVHIPEDINLESLGQRWELDDWLEEITLQDQEDGSEIRHAEPDRLDLLAVPVLAVYLVPGYYGVRFEDIAQAKALAPHIAQMPVTAALPLAAFFLSKKQHPTPSGRLSFRTQCPPTPLSSGLWPKCLSWIRRFLSRKQR